MDIRGIAKRARVSIATASRATNHVPTVHPLLARRVWKAVEELGYFPNTQARALASGKTRTLGLIISEITNPFFSEVLHSFEEIAARHNYETFVSFVRHDRKRVSGLAGRMIGRRVDGAAIITFGVEDSLIEHFRQRKIPVVRVGVEPSVPLVANIRINYENGIRQAVQHLAALRHVRIAFITGPPHLESARARREAFETCMREIGLKVPGGSILDGDHGIEGGSQAFREIMASSNRPSAVICSNDMTAIGLMRAAFASGMRVPEDLSVVGFDDIRLAPFTTPPLTTVQMSQAMLAEYAFMALRSEVNRSSNLQSMGEYELVTHLVLRQSTCPPISRTKRATEKRK